MTLFRFKKAGAIPGHDDTYNTGIEGRCWAFVVEKWGIGFEHQCLWGDEWGAGVGYYAVGVWRKFKFGFMSTYYDGNHNSINLGPFYFTWWS